MRAQRPTTRTDARGLVFKHYYDHSGRRTMTLIDEATRGVYVPPPPESFTMKGRGQK